MAHPRSGAGQNGWFKHFQSEGRGGRISPRSPAKRGSLESEASQLRVRRCRIEQPVTLGSHRLEAGRERGASRDHPASSRDLPRKGKPGVGSQKGAGLEAVAAISRERPRSPAKICPAGLRAGHVRTRPPSGNRTGERNAGRGERFAAAACQRSGKIGRSLRHYPSATQREGPDEFRPDDCG